MSAQTRRKQTGLVQAGQKLFFANPSLINARKRNEELDESRPGPHVSKLKIVPSWPKLQLSKQEPDSNQPEPGTKPKSL